MSNETLMTEAADTTAEAADPQAAGDAGAPEAQAGQAAADAGQDKPAAGAPEAYEFTAPDGVSFDGGVLGAFSEVAKELALPQESAQKVLDKMAPVLAARQTEQLTAAREQWAESARADKEFGGDKLAENLGVAKKALDAFATPELRTLLDQSGLGNHPEVIRMFYRAGRAISEDGFVSGRAAGGQDGDARRLYAKSNMNP